MELITLDGSEGEGGGQILRTALSFSMLTKKPFKMINIRKNRPEPGLKPQHLSAVKFFTDNSTSKAIGGELSSQELLFIPGEWRQITNSVDIGTAGSITLFLQGILLPLMFCRKCRLSIKGGTDVSWSIPVSTFSMSFLVFLRRYAKIDFNIVKRGYYPKGQGVAEISLTPRIRVYDFPSFEEFLAEAGKMGRINLAKRGNLISIRGESHASSLLQGSHVSEHMAAAATLELKKLGCNINITESYSPSESPGSGITLSAIFSQDGSPEFDVNNPIILSSDALGERDKASEKVGFEASSKLISLIKSGAAADSFLADQLIPLLAIFGGEMKTDKITNHLKSNIEVAEAFLGKRFTIDEKEGLVSTTF